MAEIDLRTMLVRVHVLHSQLSVLDAPSSVMKPLALWLSEMETELRGANLSGIAADHIGVSDSATVELVNVRGPKNEH